MVCEDGWALAIGTRRGVSRPLVGLFDQEGSRWRTVALDDGSGLGLDSEMFDIPFTLMTQLAGRLGSAIAPAVSLGTVYMQLNTGRSSNYWTLSGVMNADGSDWLIAVIQPLDSSAVVSVDVYRWSGQAWTRQGSVDRIPDQGNIIGVGDWYRALSTTGSTAPGFVVRSNDITPSWSVVISDAGGRWHAAS
jgi:hypothetical protein